MYFTNEPNDVKCSMTMTDYVQLFVFVLYWLQMKLKDFANFIEQHLVPYEYTSISYRSLYVVIIRRRGFYCMIVIDKLHYAHY